MLFVGSFQNKTYNSVHLQSDLVLQFSDKNVLPRKLENGTCWLSKKGLFCASLRFLAYGNCKKNKQKNKMTKLWLSQHGSFIGTAIFLKLGPSKRL